MAKQRDQFSVSLPIRERRKLDRLAKDDGRSRSGYVKRLIQRHLSEVGGKAALRSPDMRRPAREGGPRSQ
jgi:predicted DNA-binding protein